MLEPRKYESWLKSRPNMRFLGGVPVFDLWFKDDQEAIERGVNIPAPDVLSYLVVVSSVNRAFDEFRLPLHLNPEINLSMAPEERKLRGRWGDIHLSRAQVNEIETYLRCFAPWVLGYSLTKQGHGDG